MQDFVIVGSELTETALQTVSQTNTWLTNQPCFMQQGLARYVGVAANLAQQKQTQQAATALQLDTACLPTGLSWQNIRLVVSDMDSTFITVECIDELAALYGIKDQVAAITEQAMQGELDFAQALRARVALLKGLPESALMTVYTDKIRLMAGAETLLKTCSDYNIPFVLLSGGFTFFTGLLAEKHQLHAHHANQLVVENGQLTGELLGDVVDAEAKSRWLQHYQRSLGCLPEQVLAIGDGANDIPMLKQAGLGVAFNAKPKVVEQADLHIQHGDLGDLVRLLLPVQPAFQGQ